MHFLPLVARVVELDQFSDPRPQCPLCLLPVVLCKCPVTLFVVVTGTGLPALRSFCLMYFSCSCLRRSSALGLALLPCLDAPDLCRAGVEQVVAVGLDAAPLLPDALGVVDGLARWVEELPVTRSMRSCFH